MQISYLISEDDYVEAMMLGSQMKLRGFLRLAVLIVVFLLVLMLINQDFLASTVGAAFGFGLFIAAYFFILRRFVVPRSLRKYYQSHRLMHDPVVVELTDTGVEQTSECYSTKLRWDYVMGWREDEKYFLIATAPRMYHILPMRLAEDGFDFDTLRTRLQAAGKSVL